MKTIPQILSITEQQHDQHVFNLWMRWCQAKSRHTKTVENLPDLQQLVANSALFSWWRAQLDTIEDDFIEKYTHYAGVDPEQLLKEWKNHAKEIYNYHSFPLVKQARKLKIETQLN